jgi:hypothetical protein
VNAPEVVTREFVDGLVAGAIASCVGAVAYVSTRSPRVAVPAGGLLFAAAGVAAMASWRDIPAALVVGFVGVACATAIVSFSPLPGWSAPVAVSPFAYLIAEHARLPGVGWLRVVVFAAVCVLGPLVGAGDALWKSVAVGPALLAVTIAGIYLCTPDTEEVRTLLGVVIVLATLGWPLAWLRLGRAGSVTAVALVVWAAATDARGRPGTMLGAVACICVLGVAPLTAARAGRLRRAPLMISLQIALVAIAVIVTRTFTAR